MDNVLRNGSVRLANGNDTCWADDVRALRAGLFSLAASKSSFTRDNNDENTSKEHERNALPDILMTMAQIPVPDVTQELADVWALHALFAAAQRNEE
ncbi:MAG: hypothetical protein WBN15_01065 [Polyangiales bacterium]|jgi:hypothetical protein